MIEVEVLVEARQWKKNLNKLKKIIFHIVKKFPKQFIFVNKKVYISVLLTNNKKIQLLNKKFRKKNKPTDILSFPSFNKKKLKQIIKNKNIYLGDIAISYEEFYKKNKNDFINGFIKIFIHGFLHLLSFDHKLNKDYKVMSRIEKKIFKKIDESFDHKKK